MDSLKMGVNLQFCVEFDLESQRQSFEYYFH